MTPLEQQLADRFRRNGDVLLSDLPDWPNSVIVVGEELTLDINRERINPDVKTPKIYRHSFSLPTACLVHVQELAGFDTMEDFVIVNARVLADRKADGPVIGLTGIKKWYDQAGRTWRLMMWTTAGYPLVRSWSDHGNSEKLCIASIRRRMRAFKKTYGDLDTKLGSCSPAVLWDPKVKWNGARVTHFDLSASGDLLTHTIDDAGFRSKVDVRQASDGTWLISRSVIDLRAFVERHEAELKESEGVVDLDDAALEGFSL